jgi:glycosyltransferase involved in cell wall biosynthesis/8-oxo-dGTP pyrophosphatase MutT (NUDIX family)
MRVPACLTFLSIATEWLSRKGGVSTLNRDLCKALSSAGHTVYCFVPKAEPEERIDARAASVKIIVGDSPSGSSADACLYRRAPLPASVHPDVVIGHSRFTGPAARVQVDDYFKHAIRLHFVHTAPGEIGALTGTPLEEASGLPEEREDIDIELSASADLVVTIGPLLYDEFKTLLIGKNANVPIHQLNPGLLDRDPASELPPQYRCLVLGRAKEIRQKGLDIAAKSVGHVRTERIGGDPILVVRGAPQGTVAELRGKLEVLAGSGPTRIRVKEFTPMEAKVSEDIRSASLLLMPSRAEGFGLVGLEGISMEVPTLLSHRSGLGQLLMAEIKELARPLVIPVTGDLDTDAIEWSRAIEGLLSNRLAAFEHARRVKKELTNILSWEFAVRSLLNAIGTLHASRVRTFTESNRFEGTALVSASQRRLIVEQTAAVRQRAYETLMRSAVKWGPSLFSSTRKVANVCEVLLAFDDNFVKLHIEDLIEPIQWLLTQQRQGGFPSLSRDLVTTHCTALGALACAQIAKWPFLDHMRASAAEASRRASEACLRMAGERGWGTWGKGGIRMQPTIWALRALALNPEEFGEELFRRFEQLRVMHTVGEPGCFGFKPGTDRRVSPTASFLLLCADLKTIGYTPASHERYYLEMYNAAQFLANAALNTEWNSEVELYYVDPEYVGFVGNVEQLSWFHVSAPLALEALARHPDLTSQSESVEGWVRKAFGIIERCDADSGMFQDRTFAEAGLTEPVFPTAYTCMALRSFEQWMSRFDNVPLLVEPPLPEFENRTIRKVGAAIIRDGKLLLVRKFGTAQLIMPGGGVERGEDVEHALRRELEEELGIKTISVDPGPLDVYCAQAAFEPGLQVEITLYRTSTEDTPIPRGEIEEVIWFSPSEARDVLSPIIRDHIYPDLLRRALL